jgi:hypothetical protein
MSRRVWRSHGRLSRVASALTREFTTSSSPAARTALPAFDRADAPDRAGAEGLVAVVHAMVDATERDEARPALADIEETA